MQIARQHGKQSRLKPVQDREIRRMHHSGDYSGQPVPGMFLHPGSDLEALSHLLPQPLAAFTSLNIAGVRNPYAGLAARLSPAELPPPPRQRPARPPWCGQCDEITRMLGFYGDAPRRCPRCKPWVAASRAVRRDNGPLSRRPPPESWG